MIHTQRTPSSIVCQSSTRCNYIIVVVEWLKNRQKKRKMICMLGHVLLRYCCPSQMGRQRTSPIPMNTTLRIKSNFGS